VEAVAEQVRYGSEMAFNKAFKRTNGSQTCQFVKLKVSSRLHAERKAGWQGSRKILS
jgi:AraC-like DNA-binding protein